MFGKSLHLQLIVTKLSLINFNIFNMTQCEVPSKTGTPVVTSVPESRTKPEVLPDEYNARTA